jgi:integrase
MIQDVIRDTLSVLERQGYKVHNTRKYNTIYHGLAKYCWNNYDGEYTQEIGESFVQSLRERNPSLSKSFLNTYITAVERANHVIEGEENWYPRKKFFDYDDSAFRNEAAMYNEYLLNSGKTKSDVRGRMHVVARFLLFIDVAGVKKLSELNAQHIYEAFQEANDKGGFHKCVGAFLRYLYRHSFTEQDFSVIVPSVSRHVPVPTVYSPEEVEKIVETSSRSKSCGKRNKAIVLIAARLGLRSCDIANLRFENIHRDRETIELRQLKTKQPLALPLLPEVRDALDDYIESERSKCDNDHIFLLGSSPVGGAMQPYSVYTVVSRIVKSSGIDVNGRKRGAHALRSSLATALLNEGYNHSEVKDALGQKSPNAVKSYIKTEVEHLRDYALSVPAPSGLFAATLGLKVIV